MSKGKFALGALLGAAVGVAAGILTAPKSGKETRAELKVRADEAKKKADKAIADAREKGESFYEDVRDRAEGAYIDAKSTASDYAERVKRAAATAKAELDREDESGQKKQ